MGTPIYNSTQFTKYIGDIFWEQWEAYIATNPLNTRFLDRDWRYKFFTAEENDDYTDNFRTVRVYAIDDDHAYEQLYDEMRGSPTDELYEILSVTIEYAGPSRFRAEWLYTFEIQYLPGNPNFEYKWTIQFTRLWGTESTLPTDEIQLNDDDALHSYIENNVPSVDMTKTVEYVSTAVAAQLQYVLDDEKFESVGPIYAKDNRPFVSNPFTGSRIYFDRIDIYPYDPEVADRPEIPILHIQEPNNLTSQVQELYFWQYWTNPRGANTAWLRQEGLDGDRRYSAIAKLVNSWVVHGGIFCELEDPNGFIKDTEALQYVPTHKMQRVLHDFADNWEYDTMDNPNNTYEVVHYPKEDILSVNVSHIGNNTSISYPRASKTNFKISDVITSVENLPSGKTRVTIDAPAGTYRGENSDFLLYVNDFNFTVSELKVIRRGRFGVPLAYAFEYTPNDYFKVDIGDEIDIFNNNDVSDSLRNVKRVFFDGIVPTQWSVDHALAIGNHILPILAYGKKNVATVDEPYTGYYADVVDTNDFLQIGKATIIRYHSVSVPGEPIDNPLLEITVTMGNFNYEPTNDREDYSHRAYFGTIRPPEHWARDLTTCYKGVLHALIDRWVVKAKMSFNEFNVISQHDRDWGIGKPILTIEQNII